MLRIIDYKAGNAPSVLRAALRLNYKAAFARSASDLADATHIILPGVGSAKATMESLKEMGLVSALEDMVFVKKIPFFGICVGLQILFEHSEEDDVDCLGWLKGDVRRFDAARVRVPQIGWNKVGFVKQTPCDAKEGYYYFVNSYQAVLKNEADLWATADYNGIFTAAVCKDNIFATQFHIEKSGETGLNILDDFMKIGG